VLISAPEVVSEASLADITACLSRSRLRGSRNGGVPVQNCV
jgi:hypothetical protein